MSDFANDPWWGKGGRYVVDPATGQRTPAPEEGPGTNETLPGEPGPGEQASASLPQPVKEKRRG